jgi:hypothetical protein
MSFLKYHGTGTTQIQNIHTAVVIDTAIIVSHYVLKQL